MTLWSIFKYPVTYACVHGLHTHIHEYAHTWIYACMHAYRHTYMQVDCLICTHNALGDTVLKGVQYPRVMVEISGIARVPMLHFNIVMMFIYTVLLIMGFY